MLAIVGAAALVLVAVVRLGEPGYDLGGYPVRELDRLAEHHVDLQRVHMAVPDRVGNLIELRDGPGRRVFFDDRFDMFPDRVSNDVLTLVQGGPGARNILARRHIDLVLWRDSLPLVSILRADGTAWRPVFDGARDDGWALLCRVGADLGGDLGSC